MFGLNDTNQSDSSVPTEDKPAPALPANPFAKDATLPAQPSAAPAAPEPDATSVKPEPPGDDALISLKEQALNSLSPLVGHLEQTPEEKFKTLMMLIQASDNANLIKDAYEAANSLQDEKARAQALLDVINEINYFTQKDGKPED